MVTALHSKSYMRSRVTHTLSICPTAATAHASLRLQCSQMLSSVCSRSLPLVPVFLPRLHPAVLKRQLVVPQKLTHSVFNSGSFPTVSRQAIIK